MLEGLWGHAERNSALSHGIIIETAIRIRTPRYMLPGLYLWSSEKAAQKGVRTAARISISLLCPQQSQAQCTRVKTTVVGIFARQDG